MPIVHTNLCVRYITYTVYDILLKLRIYDVYDIHKLFGSIEIKGQNIYEASHIILKIIGGLGCFSAYGYFTGVYSCVCTANRLNSCANKLVT